MLTKRKFLSLCGALVACSVTLIGPGQAQDATVGATRVARWKDDKKAAFLLMFDDGWPSHWQVALPELLKRHLTATFYVVPNKGEFKKFEKTWREQFLQQGMALANHTLTHDGLQNLEDAEHEFTDCTLYLNALISEVTKSKEPRLLSYGKPGVSDWKITAEQEKELIAKNHLIERPTFVGHGANYHLKTTEEMLALADKAIANGGIEYLVIHGVERIVPDWKYQDFWALKQDIFLPLLDALAERRDRGDLWITDHISQHKYETERSSAETRLMEATDQRLLLELTSKADTQLYDFPLTLITQVPEKWKQCKVTQGASKSVVTALKGTLQFEALPSHEPILIVPVAA